MSTRNLVGLFYFWKMLCDKVYPLNYAGMGNLLMFVKVAGSWLKYRPENHCRVLLPPEKNPQVYKCKCQQHTNTNANNTQTQMKTNGKSWTGKFPPQAIYGWEGKKMEGSCPSRDWQLFRFKFARGLVCKYMLTHKNTHKTNSQEFILYIHTKCYSWPRTHKLWDTWKIPLINGDSHRYMFKYQS